MVAGERGAVDGQVVAATKAGMPVRLTLTGAPDELMWDKSTCTLRVESLRGRGNAVEIDRPDAAWFDKNLEAGAVRLVLLDPQDEIALPLTRQT